MVDCTASDTVAARYPAWLRAGLSVVTPNKRAFSGAPELYAEIEMLAGNMPGSTPGIGFFFTFY
jgi:homoserine dehydrogenase